MTARITSRQVGRIKQLLGEALEGTQLTKDVVQNRIIGQGGVLKKRFLAMVLALAAEYFILLSDEEADEWFRKVAGKTNDEARRLVTGYRRGAREHEVADSESCHIQVVSGATLKRTIPQIGPCVEDLRYLQGWYFPDPPTQDCVVSFIPTLLRDSTNETVNEQKVLLALVRSRLDLPESHLIGFGSVTHLAGVALVHKASGNRVIFAGKVARTDTCDSDGGRLSLVWCGGRLFCAYWLLDGERNDNVGVLACGVEKALGS